jgi:hypothetical protein
LHGIILLGCFALVFVASRQHTWARVRVAVAGLWLFTVLTLIATLIHIALFRMDSVCLFLQRLCLWGLAVDLSTALVGILIQS